MRYFGGKQRVAREIVEIIKAFRVSDDQLFFEPFLGGANIVTRIGGRRAAADANVDLIAMYKAIQQGWVPPVALSEAQYAELKTSAAPSALRAFAGFGCSFAGKWFGGYARSGTRNYAANAHNALMAKAPGLVGVALFAKPYDEFTPTRCLIYADPPYQGTTQYGAIGDFDSDKFWRTMQVWSQQNTVLVSEYVAPEGCEVVWEKQVVTDIRGRAGKLPRVEKLFLVH